MTTQDFVIQTAVAQELAGALKAHAALRNVLMFDVFAEAIEQFFAQRAGLSKKRQSVPYLMSPKDSRPLNVRIPLKLAQRVQIEADEDNVPPRRFVYTALVHYAVRHKLMTSIGTIESGVVAIDKTSRSVEKVPAVRKRS